MATDKGQKDKQRSTKHNTVWMIGVLRGNKTTFQCDDMIHKQSKN
jgi:hypothetical protein